MCKSSKVAISPSKTTVLACIGETVNLTCTTTGFTIGYWASAEYIGGSGHRLQFSKELLHEIRNSTVDDNTFATLIDAFEENGTEVLKIQLTCRVTMGGRFVCGGEGDPGDETSIILVLSEYM